MKVDRPQGSPDEKIGWGSDIAAQMLRRIGFPYISLNPGASYRGLHDSIVNHLGNETPSMILCLHEDHAVGVAHGYARATGEPMACVLHSNVGLLHGMMGLYNAWCDRMPIFVLGATGPIDAALRRPWIDWIHTSTDQAALIRDFVKWDNQPNSPESLVEAMARANILARAEPRGPTYICLDAGLQEASLEKEPRWPDLERLQPPKPPSGERESLRRAADLLRAAKRPILLFGRGDWTKESWNRRAELAERVGAVVMTDLKNRAVFPTDHPNHVVAPFDNVGRAPKNVRDILAESDLIVMLEWVDPHSALRDRADGAKTPYVVAVSLDHTLHNGAHMNYMALPEVDLFLAASSDSVVADLLELLPKTKRECWRKPERRTPKTDGTKIRVDHIAVALRNNFEDPDKVSLAGVCREWPCDVWPFHDPSAYLGKDGGGGLGGMPSMAVGSALALHTRGRHTVAILGDGDFLMGGSAIWTAVRHRIPLLLIINNNRSYFNDELHQETVARRRNRPAENRWIGQRIGDPDVDLAKFVESQGAVGIGPVTSVDELEKAIARGATILKEGGVCLIDVHVEPAGRGAETTGVRKT
jgi:thiamine pyrophosphate-dependent acetolactate synthase large subunit-like protein